MAMKLCRWVLEDGSVYVLDRPVSYKELLILISKGLRSS